MSTSPAKRKKPRPKFKHPETRKLKAELTALKTKFARSESRLKTEVRDHVMLEFNEWLNSNLRPLLELLESRIGTVEQEFEDRVKNVAETILQNLREAGAGLQTPRNSGSLASPSGNLADQGIVGPRLPGSFESGFRR